MGDIAVGTALGYVSVYLYYYLNSQALAFSSLGSTVWRQLILASVIGALVVRKADAHREDNDILSSARETIAGVLGRAACAGTLLLAVGLVTGALHHLATLWLLAWAGLFVIWMCLSRLLVLGYRQHTARRGGSRETIAIIGARAALARLAAQLAKDACVTALIDHSAIAGHALSEAMARIVSLARDGAIGLVVIATDEGEPPQTLDHILDRLRAAPVRVALCSSAAGTVFGSSDLVMIGGVPMSLIADRPLSRRDMLVKMVIDKLGALLLIVLALPLLVAVSLAILLETGGPIIFQQRRNGWCGRLFTVYKFRTMRHAPGQHVLHQTLHADPRCTRVGSFLRRTSLDELPQLWNVLRGDMSLVGPRPHADFMHARERANCGPVADYAQRQRVKPGLTGWAQVHGLRGAVDTPEKLRQRVEFDRYYIENWSVWLDLQILAQTPWAVLSRENAF